MKLTRISPKAAILAPFILVLIFSDYIYQSLLVVSKPLTMAGVFPMDDVVLDGCDSVNGHDNFSDDDCIEVKILPLISSLDFNYLYIF